MFSESENVFGQSLWSTFGGGGVGVSGNFRKGHGRKVEKFVG